MNSVHTTGWVGEGTWESRHWCRLLLGREGAHSHSGEELALVSDEGS